MISTSSDPSSSHPRKKHPFFSYARMHGKDSKSVYRILTQHRLALTVLSLVLGAFVGLAASIFQYCIIGWSWLMTGYTDYALHPGAAHGVLGWPAWLIIFVPIISGLIYGPLITYFAPSARGHGIPEVILAVRKFAGRIPGKVAIVKIIGSALTIGGGGSAGREGPIVQVGASLGSWLSMKLHLKPHVIILFAACGSAAGIAATFNAPLAGACFAVEVVLGALTARTFIFLVFGAVGASVTSRLVLGNHYYISLPQHLVMTSSVDLAWIVLVAVVSGLAGLGFAKFLYLLEDGIDAIYHLPEWMRPVLGSIVLGIGLYFFPIMYSAGTSIQAKALAGSYGIGMLLLLGLGRTLFTAWTIGIGGSGGVFAPTLFVGATAGMACGLAIEPWSHTAPAVYGVVGMAAAFAAAARAPLTAALIIMEMTGQYHLIIPLMLAVGIATGISMFLTRSTIYTQKLYRRGDLIEEIEGLSSWGYRMQQRWHDNHHEPLTLHYVRDHYFHFHFPHHEPHPRSIQEADNILREQQERHERGERGQFD